VLALGQRLPNQALARPAGWGGLLQRDAAIDTRLGQAAVGAVDLAPRNRGLVRCRYNQRPLAGRTPGLATDELWLDLELHTALWTGERDHEGPRNRRDCVRTARQLFDCSTEASRSKVCNAGRMRPLDLRHLCG